MFCNFCGKNFDSNEGFEEAVRSGHHYIRCEKCVYNQAEEPYDWRIQMYGRGQQMQATTTVLVTMRHPGPQYEITSSHWLRLIGEFRGTDEQGAPKRREIHILAAYDADGRNRELTIQGKERV